MSVRVRACFLFSFPFLGLGGVWVFFGEVGWLFGGRGTEVLVEEEENVTMDYTQDLFFRTVHNKYFVRLSRKIEKYTMRKMSLLVIGS